MLLSYHSFDDLSSRLYFNYLSLLDLRIKLPDLRIKLPDLRIKLPDLKALIRFYMGFIRFIFKAHLETKEPVPCFLYKYVSENPNRVIQSFIFRLLSLSDGCKSSCRSECS